MSNHARQQNIYQKIRFVLAAFTFLLGVMPGLGLAATLNQDWVARYNGPANDWDNARAVGVDAAGNVYVTGLSAGSSAYNYDYATIKYDASGNQLWLVRYNGPGNGWDEATAMAVDAAGNVYVTGLSGAVPSTGHDYVTIKYDTNGNQLWLALYNGPGNRADIPTNLAVDANGNVYVTGYSGNPSAPDDYATIKYDASGNQLWVARYSGSASAIALDAAGNVYVTGKSYDSITLFDYATIKYDSNGNQLWVTRYNGPENSSDAATDLAVDVAGNVYVTGNAGTLKYDSNGNQLWGAPLGGISLAVDAAGSIYVAGSVASNNGDYATQKYDTNGNQLWVASYNGPGNGMDVAKALALDGSGNVYVSGSSIGSTYRDYATIQYDANGNQLSVARYNGPGNNEDYAAALAVDASGNVYVTGMSKGTGNVNDLFLKAFDYATIKYSEGAVNTAPTANPQSVSTPEQTILHLALTGSDPEGDVISFAITTLPAHGELREYHGLIYIPDINYNGPDSFTFTASDGALTSAPATVSITVTPVNDAPVANAGSDQTISAKSSKGELVTLNGSVSSDPDGDALTYTWSGSFGTVSGVNPVVKLVPGSYTITLTVSDGQLTATDTVVIEVVKSKK